MTRKKRTIRMAIVSPLYEYGLVLRSALRSSAK